MLLYIICVIRTNNQKIKFFIIIYQSFDCKYPELMKKLNRDHIRYNYMLSKY